jgi:hypothetical protein
LVAAAAAASGKVSIPVWLVVMVVDMKFFGARV